MVLRVVADGNDASARNNADFAEHFQERPAGWNPEQLRESGGLWFHHHKLSERTWSRRSAGPRKGAADRTSRIDRAWFVESPANPDRCRNAAECNRQFRQHRPEPAQDLPASQPIRPLAAESGQVAVKAMAFVPGRFITVPARIPNRSDGRSPRQRGERYDPHNASRPKRRSTDRPRHDTGAPSRAIVDANE
jgi:hypothetical protein